MEQNKLPVIEFELLSALAARLCNPDAPGQAATELEGALIKLKRLAIVFDNVRWVAFWIGLIFAVAGIGSALAQTQTSCLQLPLAYRFLIAGMSLSLFAIAAPRLIQTRKRFFVANRYDAAIPVAAQNLLTDLAEGRRTAVLLIDYGVAGPEAVRTADGKLLDVQIAAACLPTGSPRFCFRPTRGHGCWSASRFVTRSRARFISCTKSRQCRILPQPKQTKHKPTPFPTVKNGAAMSLGI